MIIRSEEIYKKANSIVKSCGTRDTLKIDVYKRQVFFIPAITIREIALLELSTFHLCLERSRNLAGDVLRVKGVDHVLQRDDRCV